MISGRVRAEPRPLVGPHDITAASSLPSATFTLLAAGVPDCAGLLWLSSGVLGAEPLIGNLGQNLVLLAGGAVWGDPCVHVCDRGR